MRHAGQTHKHVPLMHLLCSGQKYISMLFHLLVYYQPYFAKSRTKKPQEWLWFQIGQYRDGMSQAHTDASQTTSQNKAGKTFLLLPSHPNEVHPLWKKLSLLVCHLPGRA
jgi:hypothetical protein